MRLKHLLRLQYGSALAADDREEGNVHVYGSNGPIGHHNCSNMLAPAIIVGRKGSHGKVVWAGQGGFCIDTALFVDRRHSDSHLRYSYYLLQMLGLDEPSKDSAVPGLDRFEAHNKTIPSHDTDSQKAIADFLDRETARIDQLIEKKTCFIVLLKEERAAMIAHAVTQGTDPDVQFKNSGLDWLGKIPADWQIVPPTVLFTESKERAREGDQLLSATQKYGVIPLAEYEELEQRQVTLAVANLEMRKHVEIGDFVISMRSMDGGLERARAIGSVRSSYSVLKPGPNVVGRFYGALLKSSPYIQALRLTSNFIRDGQDMNFSHFRKVRLPKLDVREQAAIADHIEGETSRIDSLITLTERSIDRLREFRFAHITAAVTGQIDVTTWRKRGTTDRRLDAIQEEMRA